MKKFERIYQQDMKKSRTRHELSIVMNKVVENLWTSHEQVCCEELLIRLDICKQVKKLIASCEEVLENLWTSQEQVVKEFWKHCEKLWTSSEQVMSYL